MSIDLNYIAGEWRSTTNTLARENPTHPDEIIANYPVSEPEDYHAAFAAAQAAFPAWKATPIIGRARILQSAARLLESRLDTIARDLAREVGKPIGEARGEVRRAIDLLDYYAAYAWMPQGYVVASARPQTELRSKRVPLGVVALITPWNFPIAIPCWKLAPALIAGNTVVIKPSSLGAAGALHLTRALVDAGLPAGVLNLTIGPGAPFGQALAESDAVRAVSFTGSVPVGMGLKASLAANHTRVQLELGSKNPFVVWHDADLDEAARLAVEGAYFFAGQKCTATSRIIVHQDVYAPFRERLVAAVEALAIGDPLAEATRVGPLIDRKARDNVSTWARRGLDAGGKLLAGGVVPNHDGYFFAPTLIEGLPITADLAQEEVFGPLVTLHTISSLDEAIAAANATRYGLSASVATRDLHVAEAFLDGVDAGLLHVNQPTAGVEYQVPFGGTKDSSFGPKEQGWSALDFYSDWKTQVVRCYS